MRRFDRGVGGGRGRRAGFPVPERVDLVAQHFGERIPGLLKNGVKGFAVAAWLVGESPLPLHHAGAERVDCEL